MKRILPIIGFLLCFATAGISQVNEKNPGRIEALKIAFLTKRLNLSTEEAQRFWPVYNKYTDEIRQVRIEKKQNQSSELETEDKILKIRKKYNGDFTKALNADKANAFFLAEKDFGTVIQKELSERREARKNRMNQQ